MSCLHSAELGPILWRRVSLKNTSYTPHVVWQRPRRKHEPTAEEEPRREIKVHSEREELTYRRPV